MLVLDKKDVLKAHRAGGIDAERLELEMLWADLCFNKVPQGLEQEVLAFVAYQGGVCSLHAIYLEVSVPDIYIYLAVHRLVERGQLGGLSPYAPYQGQRSHEQMVYWLQCKHCHQALDAGVGRCPWCGHDQEEEIGVIQPPLLPA